MLQPVLANTITALGQWMIFAQSDFKVILLLTGLTVLTGGLWSLYHHRENFGELIRQPRQETLSFRFERRKNQRRTIVACLMACCGIVLSGFYWVHEGRSFAILLALLLLLLFGITVLAMMDMVSIGLKHSIEQITEHDSETDRVIAAAIAKHKNAENNQGAATDENHS